ncbi:hypothetical protein FRC20_005327 [Serendipita sp. 405]|nr:hypothetical protein FRC15_006273 [Serendipita sp. 397]KAG8776759.1 hypothetical protein FRC16_004408 [Serendipita sp. 398]KAG8830953.1 hypothetical protein FRC18_007355 [Serendipita sp. 400]KAG8840955.1 hypothetical protein FRC20_005327 [Serendipita sp. 405]
MAICEPPLVAVAVMITFLCLHLSPHHIYHIYFLPPPSTLHLPTQSLHAPRLPQVTAPIAPLHLIHTLANKRILTHTENERSRRDYEPKRPTSSATAATTSPSAASLAYKWQRRRHEYVHEFA